MLLSIIVPVYNEENTIAKVVASVEAVDLGSYGVQKELILVDDGSRDGTADIIEELMPSHRFIFLRHEENQGKGRALCTGIQAASGDVILFQDADLEYSPSDYPALLVPILNGQADVVYGSRFADAREDLQISRQTWVANIFLTWLSNALTGLRLTDMETGSKVFRVAVIKNVQITERRFGVEPEITARLSRLVRQGDCRIREVSISYRGRKKASGKKIGFRDGVRAIYCIIKYNIWR